MMRTLRRVLMTVVMCIAAIATIGIQTPAQASTMVVYLSPTGSDANPGTLYLPIKSLARALAVLRAQQPTGDVEIRIAQGVYVAAPLKWDFYVKGHTVSFL